MGCRWRQVWPFAKALWWSCFLLSEHGHSRIRLLLSLVRKKLSLERRWMMSLASQSVGRSKAPLSSNQNKSNICSNFSGLMSIQLFPSSRTLLSMVQQCASSQHVEPTRYRSRARYPRAALWQIRWILKIHAVLQKVELKYYQFWMRALPIENYTGRIGWHQKPFCEEVWLHTYLLEICSVFAPPENTSIFAFLASEFWGHPQLKIFFKLKNYRIIL